MILTPISPDRLPHVLDRFAAALSPADAICFARIRATSPDRASGNEEARHRLAAIALAGEFGVPVHPPERPCAFNWDGAALSGASEAYVILHEIAHFVLASPERRRLIDFGLGPGPDTEDRETAHAATIVPLVESERDEAQASLLGILWEAALGQPALASFLDQNWLEGLERSAAAHFADVLGALRERGLVSMTGHPRTQPAGSLS